MLVLALALALAAPAKPAPSCDVKGLTQALRDATPGGVPKAYADLAACDAAAARAITPEAFTRVLPGQPGDDAAVLAMKLGAGEAVRAWVNGLQPDDRGPTLNRLGGRCDDPEVVKFWVESHTALGARFFEGRWYAALDACRVPEVQNLLGVALATSKKDRARFGGVVDVYARNLGKQAIPGLVDLAKGETDPLVLIDIVDAFSDAAGVGGPNGPDLEAAAAALAALGQLTPTLPEKVADQARTTHLALGDELGADKLVTVRYRSLLQPDGGLLYGLVVVEKATCKKGDLRVEAHHGSVLDSGHTWPDQLQERVADAAKVAYEMDLAESCRGTSTFEWIPSDTPLKDDAALRAWVDRTLLDVRNQAGTDVKVFPHDPIKQ